LGVLIVGLAGAPNCSGECFFMTIDN